MAVHMETDRLILRDWQAEDKAHFARMNNDPIVMEFYPRRLDEAASFKLADHFQAHIDKKGYGFFAVEQKSDGAFMGFAGIAPVPKKMPCTPSVELAWRLDYNFWGKGYATEIAQVLLAAARDEYNLKEIVAYASSRNERAHKAIDGLGFVRDTDGDFKYPGALLEGADADYILYRLAV